MMKRFGVEVENKSYKEINISNLKKYEGQEVIVEGDFSGASFFFLAAAICKSKIKIKGLNLDSKQGDKSFIYLLEEMGCKLNIHEGISIEGNELNSIDVDLQDTPDLLPPIAIAAALREHS